MFLVKTQVCTDPFWADSDQNISKVTLIEGDETTLKVRMKTMYDEDVLTLQNADREVDEESYCDSDNGSAVIYSETAVFVYNIVDKTN